MDKHSIVNWLLEENLLEADKHLEEARRIDKELKSKDSLKHTTTYNDRTKSEIVKGGMDNGKKYYGVKYNSNEYFDATIFDDYYFSINKNVEDFKDLLNVLKKYGKKIYNTETKDDISKLLTELKRHFANHNNDDTFYELNSAIAKIFHNNDIDYEYGTELIKKLGDRSESIEDIKSFITSKVPKKSMHILEKIFSTDIFKKLEKYRDQILNYAEYNKFINDIVVQSEKTKTRQDPEGFNKLMKDILTKYPSIKNKIG